MTLHLPPNELLRAALLVSMTSVWMLVLLFCYLNHYTRRPYFNTWMAAWLFHALRLTLELVAPTAPPGGCVFAICASCVAVCALLLLWGSLQFLQIPVNQRLFGLFMLFLIVWAALSPGLVISSLQTQLPVSFLHGAASMVAGGAFYRFRRRLRFVGAGMLAVGFFLWGVHIATDPITSQRMELRSAAFFLSAILQLFIAVSMIVLVLEEVRYKSEQTLRELAELRSQKQALELKIITTEEECRGLYERVRDAEGVQKAYDELRRTQRRVVQQERLRVLGQIASGVSHDVNNALTPILGYSESLRAELSNLAEPTRRKLNTIHKCAHDIARIVVRMSDLYRQRSDNEPLELVDIARALEEVAEFTRPRWRDLSQRRGVAIACVVEAEPSLPPLLADPTELREALTNLIFNSVDALPVGGLITLSARSLQPAAKDGSSSSVAIEVRDNGVGMDEQARARCLEPFFTTKGASGGSGLGLPMVSGLVQRHQGTLEIESAPGAGTAVRLVLPLRQSPSLQTPARPQPSHRRFRILCVDDQPELVEMLQVCLTGFGHDVATAPGGAQALQIFGDSLRNHKPFQVVLTDLGMPAVDGLQVARGVKSACPSTPVVMMTGWAGELKGRSEYSSDVDALIAKPCSMVELNTVLQELDCVKTATHQRSTQLACN